LGGGGEASNKKNISSSKKIPSPMTK
jgi:hypothetical protein